MILNILTKCVLECSLTCTYFVFFNEGAPKKATRLLEEST